MASLDTTFANVRDSLASSFGKSATLISRTAGGYDAVTGVTTPPTETNTSIKIRISSFSVFDKNMMNDLMIDDLKIMVLTDTAIDTNDFISIDSVEYAIVEILGNHYAVDSLIYRTLWIRKK